MTVGQVKEMLKGLPDSMEIDISNFNMRKIPHDYLIEFKGKMGMLTYLRYAGYKKNKHYAEYLCACGNIKILNMHEVKRMSVNSCGCYLKKYMKGNTHGNKHGYSRHLLYKIWKGIHERCYNPKTKGYKNYGGRGIKVVKEWKNPKTFIDWCLANGWAKKLQLDRRKNNGNYSPRNCRFVTSIVNCNNTRTCRYLNYNGEKITITQLAEKSGIPRNKIASRLRLKWTIERILSTP